MREKRQYQRAALTTSVTIRASDETTWEATSRDVSLGGMFLKGTCPMAVGTEVTLVFDLPRLGQVSVPAFLRWTTSDGFGVQFGLLGARETHAIGGLVRASSHDVESA